MEKKLHEFSIGHEELGDKVDIPISWAFVDLFTRTRFIKALEEFIERSDGSTFTTVITVPIHMKNLLASDGHKPTQNAFLDEDDKGIKIE